MFNTKERKGFGKENTLRLLIINGNKEEVEKLIKNKDDANKPIDNEWPPLMLACHHGQISIVKFLLRIAEVNFIDSGGRSPLSEAVTQRNLDLVKLLIKEDANLSMANEEFIKHYNYGIIASIQPPAKIKEIDSYNRMINFLLTNKLYPTRKEAKSYIENANNRRGEEGVDSKIIEANINILESQDKKSFFSPKPQPLPEPTNNVPAERPMLVKAC